MSQGLSDILAAASPDSPDAWLDQVSGLVKRVQRELCASTPAQDPSRAVPLSPAAQAQPGLRHSRPSDAPASAEHHMSAAPGALKPGVAIVAISQRADSVIGGVPGADGQRPEEGPRPAVAGQLPRRGTRTTPILPTSGPQAQSPASPQMMAATTARPAKAIAAKAMAGSREDASGVPEAAKATAAQPTAGSRAGEKRTIDAAPLSAGTDGVDPCQQGRRTTRSQPGAQLQELPDRACSLRRLGGWGKPALAKPLPGAAEGAGEASKEPSTKAAVKVAAAAAVDEQAPGADSDTNPPAAAATPLKQPKAAPKRSPAVLRVSRSSAGPAAAAKMHHAAAQEPGWKRKAAALSDGAAAAAAQQPAKRQKPQKDAAPAAKTFVRPPRYAGASPPIGVKRTDGKLTPWQAFEAPLRFRSLASINGDAAAQLPLRAAGRPPSPLSISSRAIVARPVQQLAAAGGPAQKSRVEQPSTEAVQPATGRTSSPAPRAVPCTATQAAPVQAASTVPAAWMPAQAPKKGVNKHLPAGTPVRRTAAQASKPSAVDKVRLRRHAKCYCCDHTSMVGQLCCSKPAAYLWYSISCTMGLH